MPRVNAITLGLQENILSSSQSSVILATMGLISAGRSCTNSNLQPKDEQEAPTGIALLQNTTLTAAQKDYS